MKRSGIGRTILVASALGAVISPLAGMTAAHAVVPAGTTVIAAAGSDTTEHLMGDLAANGYTLPNVQFFNIKANLKGPTPGPAETITVPGDANGCPNDITWSRDPLAPGANTTPTEGVAPFGSGAGRAYLKAQETGGTLAAHPGCVDVARSSGTPRTSGTGDSLSFEYYAYAMDAVSWASTSVKSPATLTTAQLAAIYDCTITDWSQVGGTAGTIQRYFPQPGSGTRSFFISDILGKPSSYTPPAASTVTGCPSDAILIEENEGTQIATADIDKAILPYSAGVWSNMESNRINPTLDLRKGALLKGITTASPQPVINGTPVQWVASNLDYELDTAGVVTETNIKLNAGSGVNYPGIRYVFNVLDNVGPTYATALSLFGFSNVAGGAKSPICDNLNHSVALSNVARAVIQSNSFALLNATTNIGGNNAAGATCRFFKPLS